MSEREDWGGPYLVAACFCRDVTIRRDEPSVHGIVDRLTILDGLAQFKGRLFVAMRAGPNRRELDLGVFGLGKDGLPTSFVPGDDQRRTIPDREDAVLQWRIPVHVVIPEPGLYWYDVVAGGRLLTRIPLRVSHPQG